MTVNRPSNLSGWLDRVLDEKAKQEMRGKKIRIQGRTPKQLAAALLRNRPASMALIFRVAKMYNVSPSSVAITLLLESRMSGAYNPELERNCELLGYTHDKGHVACKKDSAIKGKKIGSFGPAQVFRSANDPTKWGKLWEVVTDSPKFNAVWRAAYGERKPTPHDPLASILFAAASIRQKAERYNIKGDRNTLQYQYLVRAAYTGGGKNYRNALVCLKNGGAAKPGECNLYKRFMPTASLIDSAVTLLSDHFPLHLSAVSAILLAL